MRLHSRLSQAHHVVFTLVIAAALSAPASAATLPAGFTETLVAQRLSNPTAMAIAPDGRIFVCEQGGQLRVIKNGQLLGTPFLTVSVDQTGERGLLGVAFDPAFETNHYVYIYYTVPGSPPHNRVSRFTANGDVAAGDGTPILDLDDLSSATNHNGGAIHFGPDGKLYVAVGENASKPNSQSLENRLGKILRINSDGSVPNDNPTSFSGISGSPTGFNRAIWAVGLRNPYTFAFNPGGMEMFINDVGENTWEEINVGAPGANYGWPSAEGVGNNPAFTNPKFTYDHSNGVCAISGGAFYSPNAFTFPADYERDYFFADLCGGWIRRLDITTNDVTPFATGITFPVDVQVSPDGFLYYLARGGGGSSGVVARIQYTPPPLTPPTLTAYTNGLTVTLSWTASAGASSYIVEGGSAPGLTNLVSTNVGNTLFVEGLVPPGTYFVRVRAVGPGGNSGSSNEVQVAPSGAGPCATPPPAPTGYRAVTAGLGFTLAWNASPSAAFYVIEAGTAPGASDVGFANVGAATQLTSSATAGTYFTRVRAVNDCGASAPSNEVSMTLACGVAAPSGLTVAKSGTFATLSWAPSSGATGYRALVGTAPGHANAGVFDLPPATTQSFSLVGVPAGTYYVRIVATTACGPSTASNEVTLTVP